MKILSDFKFKQYFWSPTVSLSLSLSSFPTIIIFKIEDHHSSCVSVKLDLALRPESSSKIQRPETDLYIEVSLLKSGAYPGRVRCAETVRKPGQKGAGATKLDRMVLGAKNIPRYRYNTRR